MAAFCDSSCGSLARVSGLGLAVFTFRRRGSVVWACPCPPVPGPACTRPSRWGQTRPARSAALAIAHKSGPSRPGRRVGGYGRGRRLGIGGSGLEPWPGLGVRSRRSCRASPLGPRGKLPDDAAHNAAKSRPRKTRSVRLWGPEEDDLAHAPGRRRGAAAEAALVRLNEGDLRAQGAGPAKARRLCSGCGRRRVPAVAASALLALGSLPKRRHLGLPLTGIRCVSALRGHLVPLAHSSKSTTELLHMLHDRGLANADLLKARVDQLKLHDDSIHGDFRWPVGVASTLRADL